MEVSWEALRVLLELLAIGGSAAAWLSARQRARASELEKLREDTVKTVAALRERLMLAEAAVQHAPSKEAVQSIQIGLAHLQGDYKGLNEAVDGVKENLSSIRGSLGRIEEYLLNKT